MSTWKTLARKTNSLPEGWNSAEEIAADLDCEPNEVPKILAASIRDGLVEKQTFPHWQPGSRQLLFQTGYRQISKSKPAPSHPSAPSTRIPADLLPRVLATIKRNPGKPAGQIADLCRSAKHPRLRAADIKPLLTR